jgi:hypothetical protein
MFCSRLFTLCVLAGVAACATRDDAGRKKGLSRDSALIAELETQNTHQLPLPNACGTVAPQPQATVRRMLVAKELARQAGEAEILGNLREASALLRRAFALDATDPSTAYHLGRVSEAILDSTGAVAAYCRYLALGAEAVESADVRRRVNRLSDSVASTSTARGGQSLATHRAEPAPTRRLTRQQPLVKPRRVATSAGETPLSAKPRGTRTRSATTSEISQASTRSTRSTPTDKRPASRRTAKIVAVGAAVGGILAMLIARR